MKLSIIVPVYNTQGYVPRCVDSLLAQGTEDYEIILINDGSKDHSLSVIQSYEKRYPEKIRVLDLTNGGQGRARNRALEIARGDYIGFADSDDWVDARMFSSLLTAAEVAGADLAVCDSWRVAEDGTKTYEKACPQEHPLAAAGSVWNKLIRRDLIGEIRFPEGVWYEDLAFTAKVLSRAQKTVYIPEALYFYRSGHPSTMRNQNAQKNLDMLKVMDDVIAFLREEDASAQDDIEFLLLSHVLLESIKRVQLQKSPDKKKVIKTFRDYVRRYIPDLNTCKSFQQESRNRRIIMKLNYYGLEDVSAVLLAVKSRL